MAARCRRTRSRCASIARCKARTSAEYSATFASCETQKSAKNKLMQRRNPARSVNVPSRSPAMHCGGNNARAGPERRGGAQRAPRSGGLAELASTMSGRERSRAFDARRPGGRREATLRGRAAQISRHCLAPHSFLRAIRLVGDFVPPTDPSTSIRSSFRTTCVGGEDFRCCPAL
jgi:hypothetical protein